MHHVFMAHIPHKQGTLLQGSLKVINTGSFSNIKGVIQYDFKCPFLFGVLQAVCAYIRSLKLQRLKSQSQRDILYES